jgi:hypothetical protein
MDNACQVYLSDNIADRTWPLRSATDGATLLTAPDTALAWSQPMTVLPSSAVPEYVLSFAGSRPKARNSIDQRIVGEVRAGTGTIPDKVSAVGGFPAYTPATRPLSLPANPAGDDDGDGCTNNEEALHAMSLGLEGEPSVSVSRRTQSQRNGPVLAAHAAGGLRMSLAGRHPDSRVDIYSARGVKVASYLVNDAAARMQRFVPGVYCAEVRAPGVRRRQTAMAAGVRGRL